MGEEWVLRFSMEFHNRLNPDLSGLYYGYMGKIQKQVSGEIFPPCLKKYQQYVYSLNNSMVSAMRLLGCRRQATQLRGQGR